MRRTPKHISEKLAALTLGAVVTSRWANWARSTLLSQKAQMASQTRVAVIAHVFYPELIDEIDGCRRLLPDGTPLLITVPEERRDAVAAAVAGRPLVFISAHPNRGRDIAPFLSVLQSGALDGYDAVLKIHTKRSTHLRDGDIRRKLLFLSLAGTPRAARRILALFEEPHVGIVGWSWAFRRGHSYWERNERRGRELIENLGGADGTELGFFEGSMFWFRPSALRRLRALRLTPDDFEPETGQTDGALHHSIERMFCIAARLDGYDVRDTRGHLL